MRKGDTRCKREIRRTRNVKKVRISNLQGDAADTGGGRRGRCFCIRTRGGCVGSPKFSSFSPKERKGSPIGGDADKISRRKLKFELKSEGEKEGPTERVEKPASDLPFLEQVRGRIAAPDHPKVRRKKQASKNRHEGHRVTRALHRGKKNEKRFEIR